MRSIKFRAWDENRKKMLIGDGQKEIALVGWSGDIFPMYYSSDMDGDIVNNIDMNDYLFHRDIKLMQFIGLLDKQGVEIYEGDIMRTGQCVWDNTGKSAILKVVYRAPSFEGEIINGEQLSGMIVPIHTTIHQHYEVIGNIYENPELLEVKDDL
jgi:uncharacterized phage protein (TIGR01671 family)